MGNTMNSKRPKFSEKSGETKDRDLIKAGDVLFEDDQPHMWYILEKYQGVYCSYCLERMETRVDCQNCPRLSYCSVECRLADWTAVHQYECRLYKQVQFRLDLHAQVITSRIEGLDEQFWSDMFNMMLRYHLRLFFDHESVTEPRIFPKISDKELKFDPLFSSTSFYLFRKADCFKAFGDMMAEHELRIVFTDLAATLFNLVWEKVANGDLVWYLLRTGFKNALDLTDPRNNRKYGLVIHGSRFLLQHACKPNATAWFYGRNFHVRALNDMPVGSRITIKIADFYGTYKERQMFLRKSYLLRFPCECHLCKLKLDEKLFYDDYLTYLNFAVGRELPNSISPTTLTVMEKALVLQRIIFGHYDRFNAIILSKLMVASYRKLNEVPAFGQESMRIRNKLRTYIVELEDSLRVSHGVQHPHHKLITDSMNVVRGMVHFIHSLQAFGLSE